MKQCLDCQTELLPTELFLCDPCHMSRVVDKLFTKVIEESEERS